MKENILAIPSKDRIKDESLTLLSDAGIKFKFRGRQLAAETYLPGAGKFTVALMRPKDIVRCVAKGQVQLGIVGLDTLYEYRLNLMEGDNPLYNQAPVLLGLGIGRSRLVFAVPGYSGLTSGLTTLKEVWGAFRQEPWRQTRELTVGTSYPRLTRAFINDINEPLEFEDKVSFSIDEFGGSVEVTPTLGITYAIADLVETGKTLRDNRMREIRTILPSEAVLIIKQDATQNRMVDAVQEKISLALIKRGNRFLIQEAQGYNILGSG